jgi:hypothetical protein
MSREPPGSGDSTVRDKALSSGVKSCLLIGS